ncbi:MAG: helix-turn-helix domain-containing protein [Solirubrobacteraceae bacterium]
MPRTATSEITSKVIGKTIRDARRRVGLTQVELAARLGTSAPYISGVENGRANLTIGQLAAVAGALRVELHVELRLPLPLIEPDIPTFVSNGGGL